MKKILVTRRLLRTCEDKASKIFDVKLNSNDELYSQKNIMTCHSLDTPFFVHYAREFADLILNAEPVQIKEILKEEFIGNQTGIKV